MQSKKNLKQRALVLSGGGALGAYQAGVLKILFKRLTQEDNEKGDNNRLLFDIVAGTSIGAMNGAVLVSKYLQTRNWQDAIDQLEQFWINKEEGLASTLSEQDLQEIGWKTWHDESRKENASSEVASAEAARRYYSVKHYFFKGAPKVQETSDHIQRDDIRFFDPLNKWYLHKSDLLEKTIQKFAQPSIATSRDKNEPRFLVFAVDTAEGQTVTFDSYEKVDGSRKSEYGNYRKGEKEERYENVIKYDKGVSIDHIMASGTLPEFYHYKVIDGHKFWDGGLLSNTPFREFLQAHQEYLANVMSRTKEVIDNNNDIPELEVYIVNLHPSNQKQPHQRNAPDPDRHHPPEWDPLDDHDGVKDRHNDIIYGDRSSHYDEKQAHLIGDLQDFVARLKNLSTEAISKLSEGSDKEGLKKGLEEILTTPITSSRDSKSQQGTYDDLPKRYYKLTKVVRIERTKYEDSIYGKAGDFTYETIQQLIKEGMDDATQASSLT